MEVCVRTFKLNLFFCDEVLNHILVVDYICSVSALPGEHQGQVVRLAAYFLAMRGFAACQLKKKIKPKCF
jgi:hypothetical protein